MRYSLELYLFHTKCAFVRWKTSTAYTNFSGFRRLMAPNLFNFYVAIVHLELVDLAQHLVCFGRPTGHTDRPRHQTVMRKCTVWSTGLPIRRCAILFSLYGLVKIECIHYKFAGPYGFIDRKQPVNSLCGDRKGVVRNPYGHIRRPCGIVHITVTS